MDALEELLAIEAIKRLKARYMRAVDTKDWDALAGTFAPDARSLYSGGRYTYEGREAIVGFLRGALAEPRVATMHHAHTPEIEITSDSTARGTWYLEDVVINETASAADLPGGTVLHGTGIYHDEYVRQDGEWRIALTGYERIFEHIQPCHPEARLRTRWDRD